MGRALPYLDQFRAAPFRERGAAVEEISRQLGQAANTTGRQMNALLYLERMGVDLDDLANRRAPALLAIESVSRVGKFNAAEEAVLLQALLKGEQTVEFYIRAAKAAQSAASPSGLPTLLASSILREQLFEPDPVLHGMGNFDYRIQFPGRARFLASASPMPFAVIDQQVDTISVRSAVFWVNGADPITRDPNFQSLIEGSVLRSFFTCDKVIVCSNVVLGELEKTMRQMRRGDRAIKLEYCNLIFDFIITDRNLGVITNIESLIWNNNPDDVGV